MMNLYFYKYSKNKLLKKSEIKKMCKMSPYLFIIIFQKKNFYIKKRITIISFWTHSVNICTYSDMNQ